MKKLFYILAAGLLCMAVSCKNTETPYEPGEKEVDGCYGVFFPDQDAATTHYFEPAGEKVVEVTVKRTNAEGAIDVPYVLVAENTDVYTVGTIHFDNAQEETILKVELNKTAEQATEYPLTIEIQNPQYAAKYSSNNAFFTMTSMIVTWEKLGVFTFVDNFAGQSCVADVIYYDVNGVRTCKTQNERDFKLTDPEGGFGVEEGGFWNTGADYHLEFKWYTDLQDPNDYDYLELPITYFGFDNSNLGAQVYYCDYFNYYQLNGRLTSYDFASYVAAGNPNGFTLCHYDPRGELYFYFATPIGDTGYWYGASSIQGLMDGYTPTDYSLSIAPDVSSEGKLPITVTTGADVASIAYIVYEGALGKAVVGDHVAAIVKGTETPENMKIVSSPTLLELSLAESGEYTIIVIPANKDGELQEEEYAYATFNYLAPGDENPVEAKMGLETLSGKYAPQGFNSDTALELWAYGTDIKVAKVSVFSYIDIASVSEEDVNNYVKTKGEALSEADIEAINGEGYSIIVDKLLPGTQYVAVVYLSNGYEETWLQDNATTTGDPLPIYQDFTVDSLDEDAELGTAKDWFGTWNYYAVDFYGELGLREYQGKVKISASDTPTEGPDDHGLYDEYVLVDGLFPNAVVDGPTYGYEVGNCVVEMDVYSGAMYSCSNVTKDGKCSIHIYSKERGSWMNYADAYFSAFIPVADGYYAFVDVSQYAGTYNFTGLRVVNEYVWNAFYDLLLIDPSKDDNGVAPASVNKAIADARGRIAECVNELKGINFEDNKAFFHAVMDKYNQKQALKGVRYNAVEVPFSGKAVQAEVKASAGVSRAARYAEPKVFAY